MDLYKKLWVPFGELLTRLEERGMPVDIEHLRQAEVRDTHTHTHTHTHTDDTCYCEACPVAVLAC